MNKIIAGFDLMQPDEIKQSVKDLHLEDFVGYLLMFYGPVDSPDKPCYPMGLTRAHAEIGALLQYTLATLTDSWHGDSIDREKCIHILMDKFGYAYPEIRSPAIAPIQAPQIRPINPIGINPIGTSRCRMESVYNTRTRQWENQRVCR